MGNLSFSCVSFLLTNVEYAPHVFCEKDGDGVQAMTATGRRRTCDDGHKATANQR